MFPCHDVAQYMSCMLYDATTDIINKKLAEFSRECQNWEKKANQLTGSIPIKLPTLRVHSTYLQK